MLKVKRKLVLHLLITLMKISKETIKNYFLTKFGDHRTEQIMSIYDQLIIVLENSFVKDIFLSRLDEKK